MKKLFSFLNRLLDRTTDNSNHAANVALAQCGLFPIFDVTEDEAKMNTALKQGQGIAEKYGAYYLQPGESKKSRTNDLYSYHAIAGDKGLNSGSQYVEVGDSLITLSPDHQKALWLTGGMNHAVHGFGCIIRGYQVGDKSATVDQEVNLPYVNGCATRQIFPPERLGDPTFQQLTIPPYTSEQMHHIHSTARVVFVLSGRGFSIVGQSDQTEETELLPGMLCVLDPMCPHHFRTEDDYLTVLPVHVFSSIGGGAENNHPMFNGTKEI